MTEIWKHYDIFIVLGIIFWVLFIFKIIGLVIKKEELKNITVVTTITEMIGIPMLYLYMVETNIADKYGLMFLFVMGFLGISFCVEAIFLLFICIYSYKKRHKAIKEQNYTKNNKNNKNVINYILTSLCVLIIMFSYFVVPRQFETEEQKNVKQYVLNYMNKKYGDGNFKVVNIKNTYHSNTISEWPHKYGFWVKIKSDYIPKKVTIKLKGTNKIETDSFIDDYIDTYYADEMKNIPIDLDGTMYSDWEEYPSMYSKERIYYLNFKKYLNEKKIDKVQNDFYEKFNVIMEIKCDYILRIEVPEDLGHLPSKEELVDFCKLETDNINIKINENKNLSTYEKSNYLERLANFAKEYFNTDDEIKMNYVWYEKSGIINIKDGKITIV